MEADGYSKTLSVVEGGIHFERFLEKCSGENADRMAEGSMDGSLKGPRDGL